MSRVANEKQRDGRSTSSTPSTILKFANQTFAFACREAAAGIVLNSAGGAYEGLHVASRISFAMLSIALVFISGTLGAALLSGHSDILPPWSLPAGEAEDLPSAFLASLSALAVPRNGPYNGINTKARMSHNRCTHNAHPNSVHGPATSLPLGHDLAVVTVLNVRSASPRSKESTFQLADSLFGSKIHLLSLRSTN